MDLPWVFTYQQYDTIELILDSNDLLYSINNIVSCLAESNPVKMERSVVQSEILLPLTKYSRI